jgi:hypothetical protein
VDLAVDQCPHHPVIGILATEIDLKYAMWLSYFSVVNATGHVVMAIIFKGYNPGVVISLLLNIPVGIYAIAYLLISTTANVVGLLISIAVQAAVTFFGFVVLKPRIHAVANS